MENRYRDVNQAVYNENAYRLAKRPQIPPKEQAFEDMSTPYTKGRLTRGKGRNTSRRPNSETNSPDSPDPLDMFSSPNQRDDDGPYVAKDGSTHQYHPEYLPGKAEQMKKLHFTKNKKPQESEEGPSKENCSSVADDVFGTEMPQKKTYGRSGGKVKASSSQSTRTVGTASTRRITSPPISINVPSGSEKEEASTRPNRQPRPRPRPIRGPSRPEGSRSHDRRSSYEDSASPVSKPKTAKTRPQPQSYPPLSPLHALEKNQSRPTSPTATKSKTIQRQPFPNLTPLSSPVAPKRSLVLPSPLSTPTNKKSMKSREVSALPLPSPLNSQQSAITAKGKRRVVSQPLKGKSQGKGAAKSKSRRILSSEEEDCVDKTKPSRRPQPFPVAFSPQLTPQAPKRSSNGLDSDDDKSRKKRREHLLKTPPNADLDEDDTAVDNAIFLDPSTDPKTLCPYCDTRLPDRPTPLLRRLLANIAKKSRPSPRPTNPLGRKAPLEAFIALCQRHRFESVTLPEAERNGWPKEIAWVKLEGRVQKMKRELNALISDPNARSSSSIFWAEIMEEVKAKGSRAVAGVKNQFATFEKTQPGYYGEQGSVIIHQTLFNLFPPTSIHPDQVKPLTPNEFTQRILVPEVATRLIRQDMGVSPSKAVKILRESASYGVAMFPEDGGGWGEKKDDDDVMGVADLMVMARARKRRIELEREEREEEEMLERMQKPDTLNMGTIPPSRPKPKPKPISKLKPQASTDSANENGVVSESEVFNFENFALGSDDPEPEPQLTPPPTTISDTDDDGGIITVDEDIRSSRHVDIDLTRDSRSRSPSTSDAAISTSKSTTGTRRSRAYRRLRGGDLSSDDESTASKQLAKYKSEKRDISEPPRAPVRVDDAETSRPAAHTYPLLAARSRAGNAKPVGESFEWLLG